MHRSLHLRGVAICMLSWVVLCFDSSPLPGLMSSSVDIPVVCITG
jgi:hypothetical protein